MRQHNARALCYVPKSVSRAGALELGWVQSKNQNRVLVFKNLSYGRIEWWETRRCLVHINRPQNMGRVKQFLSDVFFRTGLIFDIQVFNSFMDSVQWLGAHDVYDAGERVPYAVISTYKDTLGFVFKAGDISHPDGYEFEWCKPSWMERFEQLSRAALQQLEMNSQALSIDAKAIQEFSTFIKDLSNPHNPVPPGRNSGVV